MQQLTQYGIKKMKNPKHHIIPRYRCKELGIDPDFSENIVEVTREDHALIHWGYFCDDLEPLFEYVRPSQEIIDLIPRGDNRDSGGASIIALGEIDGIDNIGKNHPMYGVPRSEETKRKISIANTGKHSQFKGIPRTKEWCEKVSGEGHWTYGLEPGEHPMNGFKHSEETKKKLSIAHTGKTVSEETKEKLRIVRQKQLNDEEYLKKYREGVKKAALLRKGVKIGPMSEETKKKVSIAKKEFYKNNPNVASTWCKHGEDHPSYKNGRAVNARNDPEVMRAYKAEYYQKNKKKHNEQAKRNRAKKKAERQGVGSLESFLT